MEGPCCWSEKNLLVLVSIEGAGVSSGAIAGHHQGDFQPRARRVARREGVALALWVRNVHSRRNDLITPLPLQVQERCMAATVG